MITHTANASAIKQANAGTSVDIGEPGPTLLGETECDHVAAAGSKLGGSTEGRDFPCNPHARSA